MRAAAVLAGAADADVGAMAEAFLLLDVDAGDGAQDAVDVGVIELLQLVGADEVRGAADVSRGRGRAEDGHSAELGGVERWEAGQRGGLGRIRRGVCEDGVVCLGGIVRRRGVRKGRVGESEGAEQADRVKGSHGGSWKRCGLVVAANNIANESNSQYGFPKCRVGPCQVIET
jgi:hypothetical protein